LSVDDQEHARKVWEEAAQHKVTILSDPGAKVIKQYGLLHSAGHGGGDIAIRTTLLIDPKGREVWRRVSESVPDIPTADEVLERIRKSEEQASGVDHNH
jgi:peroxiredoxin